MSNIDELIEQLRRKGLSRASALGYHSGLFDEAADALEELQAENAEMQKQLNEFSEFLCHITGGLLSKTNYTAQVMISAAEDYQQKGCGECDLRAENIRWGQVASEQDKAVDRLQTENEKLRAELEQAKAERDAAIEDIDSILAKAELIRRKIGYCLDYDSDDELASLCVDYCKNNVCEMCYEEREDGGCGNFLWRGQKEN